MEEPTLGSRIKNAWNAFFNKDPTENYRYDIGQSYSYRPDRPRLTRGNERTIINFYQFEKHLLRFYYI